MDLLLGKQEEQRKRTQKAFKFLYMNEAEMADAEIHTIKGTPPHTSMGLMHQAMQTSPAALVK
ncbi:uncharacterized protein G2W53_017555 [Senna tora]|uniref:Uncharacterized protein n=1 Tax=Senna tora TaxID=362788 RepID=A0A834TT07_9FABA|nr:uncharacterized protein G2W53_017555 [Senna tora]